MGGWQTALPSADYGDIKFFHKIHSSLDKITAGRRFFDFIKAEVVCDCNLLIKFCHGVPVWFDARFLGDMPGFMG